MPKEWFYTKEGSDKKGPISEHELRSLIANGVVKDSDLVWTDGMADWQMANTREELMQRATKTASPSPAVSDVLPPAYAHMQSGVPEGLLGWMSFVGVMTIIVGVLNLCGLIGIFLIIAGVMLMGAKTALSEVTDISPSLRPFFEKLKTFMVMTGLFYAVTLVLTIVGTIIYAMIIFAALANSGATIQ